MTAFRFYDFFAGVGLVRLGLGPSWRSVWANDIDPKKAEIYAANFGGEEFHLGDVTKVDPATLPSPVEMAWASFPCQDLSLAGWRRGMSAERSGTFWAFWRIMRNMFDRSAHPPIIVLENVVGMLYGEDFTGLCEALAALGMQFGALVIDARFFLPQSRPRVFVVAVDSRVDCGRYEETFPDGSPWFSKPVWKAWSALPRRLQDLWRWWRLPAPAAPPPGIHSIIEERPTEVEWHSKEETEKLLRLMSDVNLKKVRRAQAQPERSIGFVYKRTRNGIQRAEARFDGVAGCLRTPQGGSSRQIVLVIENGAVRSRLLSPREAARLMGVPDSFRLPANYNAAYKAMGDAVAVPAVSWLGRHLLEPIAALCRHSAAVRKAEFDPELNEKMTSAQTATEVLAAQWAGSAG